MKNWKRGAALLAALGLSLSLLGCGSSGESREEQLPPPAEPEPEPEKPLGGLVIVRETYSTQKNELEVLCFNPDTKEETLISDFVIPYDNVSGVYMAKTQINRNKFSSDYTKMAIDILMISNGKEHAGWMDLDGNFTDVTDILGLHPNSDFAEQISYNYTGFSENLFGYYYSEKNSKKEFYIPVNNLSPGAIQEGNVLEAVHPSNGNYVPSHVTDWIDDTHAIVNSWSNAGPYLSASYIIDTATQTETTYIPGDSRYNWNGVVSPDSTKIAFMSTPKKGPTAGLTDIYIVPVNGGDPIRVEGLPYVMTGRGGYQSAGGNCTLIDWI